MEPAYQFDQYGHAFEDLDLGPRWRFRSDWVYYTRDNKAEDTPLLTGAEALSLQDTKFDWSSGYRLSLGFMHDDYEIEGSYLDLNGLNGTLAGTLTNAVVFDGQAQYTAAVLAQPTVGATPNFLESNGLFSVINTAANHSSVVAADNEDNELEYLSPGAQYRLEYRSNLRDIDVNLKGRQQSGRLLRFGFGYRHIRFEDGLTARLRGSFNTVDIDGDETPGNNDLNDGLSDAALTASPGAALTLASGAGGFFENTAPTSPDQLLFTSSTSATNQLNGVQATVDATFLESDYFLIGGYAKAGVFHNNARGSVSETYQDLENGLSTYSRSFSRHKDQVAFAGNLGLTGTILLSDNVRVVGGYEVLFLSGVVVAPDQPTRIVTDISNAVSLDLRSTGNALFHGGRVGVEILFP